MIKSHPKSRIVQFHHNSDRARTLLGKSDSEIILQIEAVEHKEYDFLAEIVKREDYEIRVDENEEMEIDELLKMVKGEIK